MSKDFIRLQESHYGDTLIVNINNIACTWEGAAAIVISGNHGEGNGLFHLTQESHDRLISELKKRSMPDELDRIHEAPANG